MKLIDKEEFLKYKKSDYFSYMGFRFINKKSYSERFQLF